MPGQIEGWEVGFCLFGDLAEEAAETGLIRHFEKQTGREKVGLRAYG